MSDRQLDLRKCARLLESERQRLLENREQRDAAGAVVDLDQQRVGRLSRMDALQQQAMARAEGQRARDRLRRIDAAVARIEAGEYGDCHECGEAISTGRLEADPAATLCIDCAEARADS